MRYIIFAGNHSQFKNCLREHNIKVDEAVYISALERVYGMRLSKENVLVKYGTWYEHDWIFEAIDYLKQTKLTD